MAKPVALLEQVEATAREMRQVLMEVHQDVEELRSRLPGLIKYIEGILTAIGASVSSDEEVEDLESIELDFGGGEDEPETLI